MNKCLQKQVHATAQDIAIQLVPLLGLDKSSKDQALKVLGVACEIASKSALDMHKSLQQLMDDSIKNNIQLGDVIKCYHEKLQGQAHGIFAFSESGNPIVRVIKSGPEFSHVIEDIELESWQWEFFNRPEISFG